MNPQDPSRRPRRARWLLACGLVASLGVTAMPGGAGADDGGRGKRRFDVVFEGVVRGDLVLAGNSNLLAAGGWRPGVDVGADVDGDRSELCLERAGVDPVCEDNSSSAFLDIPASARVVHARLYVETTLSTGAAPVRVRLDGPRRGFDYVTLGARQRRAPKVEEASGAGPDGAVLRQAIWDVTKYVRRRGRGWYTGADIVSERADAFLPYASWAIVAAYELAPANQAAWPQLSPAARQRFATRALSWHDGFAYLTNRSLNVPVTGAGTGFAKSLHVVAHARAGAFDNLLFNGEPVGNNQTPGDARPPAGVELGGSRSCNSTTDVFNETVCVLGAPARTKRPGHRAYRASSDGVTRSSGSGVDMDVIRIPDRYVAAGQTAAVLTVRAGEEPVAAGVLAVSIDLGASR